MFRRQRIEDKSVKISQK